MIQQPETNQAALNATGVSLRNVLVATDFSETADRALEQALSLARTYGSKVFVVHVLPVDLMMAPELAEASRERMRQTARTEMKRAIGSGRFLNVSHEEIIEEGNLWPTLESVIQRHFIDLLVVGTHGKSLIEKLLIGSSAEEIFRHALIPVLTVGPGVWREPFYSLELKNILFATGFGVGAERQAAYAFSLAQEHRSRITLLHVQEDGDEEESTVHQLRELVPTGVEMHCLPLFRVAQGDPADEILRAAEDIQANLIVIGAKPRKSLAGHVPRSKAYRVVCGAPCPVLTIKS